MTDAFSYLSVLLSIILGLAMTQVLLGYRALLLARGRVRLYGPPLIWSGLMLVLAVQSWWASFGMESAGGWTFLAFGVVLLQTVLLFMGAAIVLPDMPASEPADLRDHYFREARPFFGLMLAMLAVSILKDWLLLRALPETANLAFHGVFAAVAVIALLVRRPLVHELIAPAMALATAAYIGLLFFEL